MAEGYQMRCIAGRETISAVAAISASRLEGGTFASNNAPSCLPAEGGNFEIGAGTRDEVIERLQHQEPALKRAGGRHLFLFGSTVRGDAGPLSDVDLFFDYDRGTFGLFALLDVMELATKLLGRQADIMTRDSLHPVLRPRIEAETLRVF